ncbi:MAG TPA: hypothetical protein PKY12_10175 [Catalimonadaceae bacterium]|nr:hypothetical protein [Catalimonadaceae bacterium]
MRVAIAIQHLLPPSVKDLQMMIGVKFQILNDEPIVFAVAIWGDERWDFNLWSIGETL